MRRLGILLGVCLAMAAAGCQLVVNAAHNAVNEPKLGLNLHRLKHKTRALATEAWEQQYAGRESNRDFRDGYIDGYADYLESGGPGEPVAAPPRRYQRVGRWTPTDMQAAADYFAGFQQGTADAQASGQRALLLVPVLVRSPDCVQPEVPQIEPAAEPLPAPVKP